MDTIYIQCKGMPYGGMVWWKKIDAAARYLVYLYIAERKEEAVNGNRLEMNEIDCIEKGRQTCYHVFERLALVDIVKDGYGRGDRSFANGNRTNLDYHVSVTAVDSNGNIIVESAKNGNRTNLDYYVSVTAEDRNGNIIAESAKILLLPLLGH